jgi:hypothetical protein
MTVTVTVTMTVTQDSLYNDSIPANFAVAPDEKITEQGHLSWLIYVKNTKSVSSVTVHNVSSELEQRNSQGIDLRRVDRSARGTDFSSVPVYVCMYVCMYVCVCVCMCIRTLYVYTYNVRV